MEFQGKKTELDVGRLGTDLLALGFVTNAVICLLCFPHLQNGAYSWVEDKHERIDLRVL